MALPQPTSPRRPTSPTPGKMTARSTRSSSSRLARRSQPSTALAPTRSTPVPLPTHTDLRSAHPDTLPIWLHYLLWWRQTTTWLAIASCVAILGLYSWTVHTQQHWSKQYEALEQMKRNERLYLLTNESLSNALREEARRNEMVPLVPERMIEVPIAEPAPPAQTPLPQDQSDRPNVLFPVGY